MATVTSLELEDFGIVTPVAWKGKRMSMNDDFVKAKSRFKFGVEQAVTIDLDGKSVSLNICRANLGFIGGFDDGNLVLQGAALDPVPPANTERMPIHLIFDKPVSAAGAHVSVVAGRFNQKYTTKMKVLLDGETLWRSLPDKPLILSSNFNTAPFLGAKVLPSQPGIKEVYFDASPVNRAPKVTHIAINELHVLD